jgi:alginate O-acetyltransferase complex protein AlgI
MSLGSWFRDYVYIPLGGNRVPKARWLCNIFIVWLLTGFWHGAAWNFMIWGLFFAVFLLVEKLWLKGFLEKHRFISHVYVMLFILLGFVIFNAADIGAAMEQISTMFGFGGQPLVSKEAIYYLRSYGVMLALAVIGSTPIVKKTYAAVVDRLKNIDTKVEVVVNVCEVLLLVLAVVVMTAYFVDGSFNPFLYFRF